jgi:hypothetical protein
MTQEEGDDGHQKELTGHPTVGVRLLGMDSFCLLRGPEHGLGGLKAFPESLRLQDQVRV